MHFETTLNISVVLLFFIIHMFEMWSLRKLKKEMRKHFDIKGIVNDWVPHLNQIFYYIGSSGEVTHSMWEDKTIEHEIREFLGIYPTRDEALLARDHVIHLIKNK